MVFQAIDVPAYGGPAGGRTVPFEWQYVAEQV